MRKFFVLSDCTKSRVRLKVILIAYAITVDLLVIARFYAELQALSVLLKVQLEFFIQLGLEFCPSVS